MSLNTFKDEITKYAKQNYKMEIVFKEDITHSLFTPGKIVFNDINISMDKKTIVGFGKLAIDLKVMTLLKGDITIESIQLKDASLDVNANDVDKLNKRFASSKDKQSTKKVQEEFKFKIKKLEIENSTLVYEDYKLKNINIDSSINQQRIDIKDINFDVYGGSASAKALINYSKKPMDLTIAGAIKKVDLNTWDKQLKSSKLSVKGLVDIIIDINWSQAAPKSPEGKVIVQSDSINITGMNLNKLLQGFIDSREVGLLDIASYAALGPIGAIITNTLETGKSYPGIGRGESQIDQFYLETQLSAGKAKMIDAAMRTSRYRLAAFGKLDLVKSVYEDFAVHVLNKKGCTRIFQSLKGSLSSPNVGATKTFAKGVISPLTNLFDKVKNITGCNPVYEGKVSHP